MKKIISTLIAITMILSLSGMTFGATTDGKVDISLAAKKGQTAVLKNGEVYDALEVIYTGNSSAKNGYKVSANKSYNEIKLDDAVVGNFTFNKSGNDKKPNPTTNLVITLTADVKVAVRWDCSKYYAYSVLDGEGVYSLPQLVQDNGKIQSFDQIWIMNVELNETEEEGTDGEGTDGNGTDGSTDGGDGEGTIDDTEYSIGFVGYYDFGGQTLNYSFYWQTRKAGEAIDWEAVFEAYAKWEASGGYGLEGLLGWQTSGTNSNYYNEVKPYVVIDDAMKAAYLENYYAAVYFAPVCEVSTDGSDNGGDNSGSGDGSEDLNKEDGEDVGDGKGDGNCGGKDDNDQGGNGKDDQGEDNNSQGGGNEGDQGQNNNSQGGNGGNDQGQNNNSQGGNSQGGNSQGGNSQGGNSQGGNGGGNQNGQGQNGGGNKQ